MIIFINDIPLRILKAQELPDEGRINHIIDAAAERVTQAKLIHHVWIKNVAEPELNLILEFLDSRVPTNVLSITISVADYDLIKEQLRNRFKIVKAAGGLIRKKEKSLMIYRMKKWDLPKGKKEKGETYRETAVREVEEECNITVKLGKRICTTWHTYTMNKRAMLKKTKWYLMEIQDEAKMKPQASEDIEDVRWMSQKEVYHALQHSYKSINYVFEQFYMKNGLKSTK